MSSKFDSNGTHTKDALTEMLHDVNRMVSLLDVELIEAAARIIAESDIVITFGNGGSHAIASHLAGDIMLRPGPFVYAIGDNVVSHTAYANDYSFEESAALAIERIVTSHTGSKKTVIIFSTSGESKNVMRAAKAAKSIGCKVIAVFGRHLHRVEPYADIIISVDGYKAGRIEAVHDAICHAIAEVIPTLTISNN